MIVRPGSPLPDGCGRAPGQVPLASTGAAAVRRPTYPFRFSQHQELRYSLWEIDSTGGLPSNNADERSLSCICKGRLKGRSPSN